MKKILSLLLLTLMLISVMPAVGLAATHGGHCEIDAEDWLECPSSIGGTFTGVFKVFLSTDTQLTKDFTIATGTTYNLCLNGYVLETKGFTITNYGTLNIFSCVTNTDHYFVYASNTSWVATTTSTGAKDPAASDTEFNGGDIAVVHGGVIYGNNQSDYTLLIKNYGNMSAEGISVVGSNKLGQLKNYSNSISTFTNSNFFGGYAIGTGTAGSVYNEGTLTYDNCMVAYNYILNSKGGAIYNGKDYTITIKDSVFKNNSSNKAGGAIYNYGKLEITDSKFIENNSNNTDGGGGAIYNTQYGDSTIKNGIFKNNISGLDGGAIYNHGKLEIIDSILDANTADRYGAIINYNGNILASGTDFINNSAKYAGAIYNYHGSMIINGGKINKNTVKEDYGALYNDNYSCATLTNVEVKENKAEYSAIENHVSNLSLISCTVIDNEKVTGVFISNMSKLVLGGSTKIKNNVSKSGKECNLNVFDYSGCISFATGDNAPTSDMEIGVYAGGHPRKETEEYTLLSTVTDIDYSGYFTSDYDEYVVGYENNCIVLKHATKVSDTVVDSTPIVAPAEKLIPTVFIGEHKDIKIDLNTGIYDVDGTGSAAIAPMFIENGRTYLGVRDIANALGVDPMAIKWNDETKTATISKSGATLDITQGNAYITLTYGNYIYKVETDASALIRNDRIYLPFRAIFQIFGYTVDWDNSTRTITCK